MAIPFLNNIDLSDNQLLNAKLQVTSTAPTAAIGQIYYNSGDAVARYYNGSANPSGPWVSITDTSLTDGTFVSTTNTGGGVEKNYTVDLSATGTPDATKYLRGDNAWEPISAIPGTYTWTVSDGGNSTAVASGETVTFSGTANEIEVAEASRTVTIGLPDDVTITNDLTVLGAGDFTGQVTIPILPVASTDAASKDYVDNAVVGGLVYQGGYDANLNLPDLTTSPNSILKGWTYTVISDGIFFTEQLRVGDVLIAEVDDPSALGDWTTVQNNIDLASLTQVGIGNVNAGTGISVAYFTGTATVTNTDTNTSNTTTGTITAGSLSGTATHTWNTKNTIVQTIDDNGDTVFCDITRTTTSATATISVAELTDITILVQRIG